MDEHDCMPAVVVEIAAHGRPDAADLAPIVYDKRLSESDSGIRRNQLVQIKHPAVVPHEWTGAAKRSHVHKFVSRHLVAF
jgi:hypothetical protein